MPKGVGYPVGGKIELKISRFDTVRPLYGDSSGVYDSGFLKAIRDRLIQFTSCESARVQFRVHPLHL